MRKKDIEKLVNEALMEYRSGYEKAYKNIPDLCYIILDLLDILEDIKYSEKEK